MTRKVIGEGSYGCVQKPSIPCETLPSPNFDYDKYVSKLMKSKYAQKELREFVLIEKYDINNDFHIETPILCDPKLTPEVIDDISECKYLKKDFLNNPDNFSLLLMKYGGPDLEAFCKDYIKKFLKKNKNIKSDGFWLEVQHLLKGLKFFRDNNLIHHDIKPQNILFNLDTGKLMFIDFGLLSTAPDIIKKSANKTNDLAIFHWSYPFETGFMDKMYYDLYKNMPNSLETYKDALARMVINGKPNIYGLPILRPDAFQILFYYIDPTGKKITKSTQLAYIQDFFNGFDKYVKNHTYEEYLDLATKTIDIFGLGFTLQYILNCFKKNRAVDNDFYTKASSLFGKMYDFNPLTRELNIENILNEYENILLETGILTRLHKDFVNHTIVDKSPIPEGIKGKAREIALKELERYAKLNSIEMEKLERRCPEGKERNPMTNRCNKLCKEGYMRNQDFKCRKYTRKRLLSSKNSTRRTEFDQFWLAK